MREHTLVAMPSSGSAGGEDVSRRPLILRRRFGPTKHRKRAEGKMQQRQEAATPKTGCTNSSPRWIRAATCPSAALRRPPACRYRTSCRCTRCTGPLTLASVRVLNGSLPCSLALARVGYSRVPLILPKEFFRHPSIALEPKTARIWTPFLH